MRALVFGKTGQVARELARCIPQGTSAQFLGREQADFSNPAACTAAIMDCDIVINAAAWTAVDLAESAEADATRVNAATPTAMARACAALGLPMIQISTDYVFDGAGDSPFVPSHPAAPLGAYGRSKLGGEDGIRASGVRHVILRTSWVFSAHGNNFLKTMLRLGAQKTALSVVADQIGGPTPASAIAAAVWTIAASLHSGHSGGTYHLSGAPDTSWADFARAIMQAADLRCTITDIPSSAYPTPAPRPLNSRLDCSAISNDFAVTRPDWRAAIPTTLKELCL